jgi:hypothetical protein
MCRLENFIRDGDRSIREPGNLADEVDDIHPESIHALVQPEPHDIVDLFDDEWVVPIEVGLLLGKKTQIVFSGLVVESPCTACSGMGRSANHRTAPPSSLNIVAV